MPACQALAAMCEVIPWRLSQHSNSHAGITMAAMLTLAAVVPQLTFASDTHYVWMIDGADVVEAPQFQIREGKMSVPTGPGLGVRLDRDKLARAHEIYQQCGMTGRDDAFTMQLIDPNWKRDAL
jgi:glucarate dehydratase